MSHIETHLRNRTATTQHDIGCIRIDENIELGRWCAIAALPHCTAHDHDLLDLRQDRRLAIDSRANVRQRACGHECDRIVVSCEQRFDEIVYGVLLLQRRLGLEYVDAVDPGLTMDCLRGPERSSHRFGAAGVHGSFLPAGDIAHHAHIALRQVERHVAADSCNTEQLDVLRRSQCEQ